ncbi:MAG: substrate-binding domain-containing protein [Bacilli bacterium]
MQKSLSRVSLFALLFAGALGLASCGPKEEVFDTSKKINRYTRDNTSGTRDGFFTALGFKAAVTDDSQIPGAIETTGNSNMITLVNNDVYGIGYISLASLATSGLKDLKFEGVAASEAAVINGTYQLSRNFNYVTRVEADCSEDEWLLINGFLQFMTSKEGLGIIKAKDGIITTSISSAAAWADILALEKNAALKALCEDEDHAQVEMKFGGSTSVEKIASALTGAFSEQCPAFKPVHNHTGSGAAYAGTQGSEKVGVNSMHIGFLSREIKNGDGGDEPAAVGSFGLICKDGIVTVVNRKNTALTNITKAVLKNIYATENITWAEVV